jgi:RimJ/RimL family protein N-acetyltransferase
MRLVRHADAASFLAAAGPFLAAREAFHQLPLAVARQCAEEPDRHPGPNLFASVEGEEGRAGVALMTPPHRLVLFAPAESAESVAAALDGEGLSPPGVHAPLGTAEAFAAAWCARRGLRAVPDRTIRAHELTAVLPLPAPPGAMRPAGPAELDLVGRWYLAFARDSGTARSSLPPDELGRRAVRQGRAFLWEDGGPASLAVVVGTTPTGARAGGVYTPPDRRRRGYATAVVAGLSRRLLAEGRRACHLFTDLANPVSNTIYAKIGYRPVADFRDFDFRPTGGTGAAPR